MNSISQTVEAKLKEIAQSMEDVKAEAVDLYKYYFATSSELVNALATANTAATTSAGGSLTKGKVLNGITMVEALQNFFGNGAVGAADHMAYAMGLINSSTPAGAVVSGDLENIGARLKSLGGTMIALNKKCLDVKKAYVASELSLAVTALSASTVVPGCATTKTKMVDGIDLVTQFINLLGAQAVSQSDWAASAARWVRE